MNSYIARKTRTTVERFYALRTKNKSLELFFFYGKASALINKRKKFVVGALKTGA